MTYDEFIQNILDTRGRFACGDEYHERHHIVPKCLGGTNDDENLIDLYAREHYEAHRLLAIEHNDNKQLTYAWWLMSNMTNKHEERYKLTAEEYEEVRLAYSETVKQRRGKLHPNYGKPLPEWHKKRLSELMTGRKLSKERRKQISESHKGIGSRGKNSMARKVECNGTIYDCIEDCAEAYNVTSGAMKMWLRGKNKMPLEFYNMGLRYYGDITTQYVVQSGCVTGAQHPNSKKVICDGVVFESLTACCKEYDVVPVTMCGWLKGRNNMPEKFKKAGLAYWNGGDDR